MNSKHPLRDQICLNLAYHGLAPRIETANRLLEAGRPEQAESVYRDDLRQWQENGWSLYGLMTSLRIQGRMDEARLVEKRYMKAFARADVVLTASRF